MTWTTRTREDGDKLYLSCADTAKLVRKALKQAFPTTKFSVRSSNYSMGASISVTWVDGPKTSQVDEVAGVYAGARFDGMVDLKTYNEHWLNPDGTVSVARSGGQGSTLLDYIGDPPSPNARLVSLGADYVLMQRSLSPETEAKIKAEIAEVTGEPFPEGHSALLGWRTFMDDGEVKLCRDDTNQSYGDNLVWQIGAQRDYSVASD